MGEMELFGQFGSLEILSVRDHRGEFWFPQQVVAESLGVTPSSITQMRKGHPAELSEFDMWTTMNLKGRKHVVYSEEGFLTICDLSHAEVAYRLRRWMRKQFRVKHHGDRLVVEARRQMERDDLSDLSPKLQAVQLLLDEVAKHERDIKRIDMEKAELQGRQEELIEVVEVSQSRITALEEAAKTKPGEMTATQLAAHVGWCSRSGAPHNLAVILAATNEGFVERGLLGERVENGPAAYGMVPVMVFTASGVTAFKNEIDSKYGIGRFAIKPEGPSVERGLKNRRNVYKT